MTLTKTLHAVLIAATLAGAVATAYAAESDYYPGAQCQQMWTTSERVMRSDGTIYNPSSTQVTVTCPLTMDDGARRYYQDVLVSVLDTQNTADVSCRIASAEPYGTWYRPEVDSGTAFVGPKVINIGESYMGRTNSITCTMPGNASAGYFIYRYIGIKNR